MTTVTRVSATSSMRLALQRVSIPGGDGSSMLETLGLVSRMFVGGKNGVAIDKAKPRLRDHTHARETVIPS